MFSKINFRTIENTEETENTQNSGIPRLPLDFQRNRYKIQTYISPLEQNNDHAWIINKIQFLSSITKPKKMYLSKSNLQELSQFLPYNQNKSLGR